MGGNGTGIGIDDNPSQVKQRTGNLRTVLLHIQRTKIVGQRNDKWCKST